MFQIRLETKDAFGTSFVHPYLVLQEDNGDLPGQRHVTSLTGGRLDQSQQWPIRWDLTQIDRPWESADEFGANHGGTTLQVGNPEAVWNIINQVANQFRVQDLPYQFLTSNSDSFASALLYSVGLNYLDYVNQLSRAGNVETSASLSVENTRVKYDLPFLPDVVGHLDLTGTGAGPAFSGIFGAEHGALDGTMETYGTIGSGILTVRLPDTTTTTHLHVDRGFIPLDGEGLFNFGLTLIGSGADDVLRGLAGDDKLNGMEGNDLLLYSKGADSLDGGAGFDTVDYSGSPFGLVIDIQAGTANFVNATAFTDRDILASIENVFGTNYSDTFNGSFYLGPTGVAMGVTFNGGGGDDIIVGSEANDFAFPPSPDAFGRIVLSQGLRGGSGNDNIRGLGGNDVLAGDDGNDTLFGDAGNDNLDGGAGANMLVGGEGNDVIRGGNGPDIMFGDEDFFSVGAKPGFADTFSIDVLGLGQDLIADFQSGLDLLLVNNIYLPGNSLFQALDSNSNGRLDGSDNFVRVEALRFEDPLTHLSDLRESTIVDFGGVVTRAAGTAADYVFWSEAVSFFGDNNIVALDISGGTVIA